MSACGAASHRSPVEQLTELGFFEYTDANRRNAMRAAIEKDPATGVFEFDTHRFFFADAEDLAEGGADDILRQMAPTLRAAGVDTLRVGREEYTADHYSIIVNGRDHMILTAAQIESDLLWGYAAAHTVMLINGLLTAAGSPEHAYGYADSNDFGIFLLTPELKEYVASLIPSRRYDPYEMTDEPPDFGSRS